MRQAIVSWLRRKFHSSPPDSFFRSLSVQAYITLVAFFNFTLHILPFSSWKKQVCRAAGIHLGKGTRICAGVRFLSLGKCKIGDHSIINRDCILDNRMGLTIGSNTSIATRCCIYSQGHDINDQNFALNGGSVIIGDHVCLFSSVLVMPQVSLGNGTVVYAGAVVTHSFPDRALVAGVPAKQIGLRELSPSYCLQADYWFN